MGVLEDLELERTRARVGALVLLTQNSNPTNYLEFVKINILNGVLDLLDEGFVRKEGESYILTDAGNKYSRLVLKDISEVIRLRPKEHLRY